MASVALGSFIAMNGVDLGLVLKSVKANAVADMKDRTTLGNSGAKTWQKALVERTVSAEGFFKSSIITSQNAHGLFNAALTSTTQDNLILFGRDGSAVGDLAEMYNISASQYNIDSVVGELLMATFEGKATSTSTANIYNSGVFLFNQAVTGLTNGTSYDSTTGGTGYLIQIHVLETQAPLDTADVKIQHSTNNSTWADLVATAIYTESTATQIASTVTSVNRYVRAVVDTNDVSSTVAVSMKVGYTG